MEKTERKRILYVDEHFSMSPHLWKGPNGEPYRVINGSSADPEIDWNVELYAAGKLGEAIDVLLLTDGEIDLIGIASYGKGIPKRIPGYDLNIFASYAKPNTFLEREGIPVFELVSSGDESTILSHLKEGDVKRDENLRENGRALMRTLHGMVPV